MGVFDVILIILGVTMAFILSVVFIDEVAKLIKRGKEPWR